MNDRYVFVFRDFRCGGTALTNSLAKLLGMRFQFVSSIDETFEDNTVLFNTHNFDMLEEVINRYNPILIRCERKNKTEQFFSLRTVTYLKNLELLNITDNTDQTLIDHFEKFTKIKVITSNESVIKFIDKRKEIDKTWKRFTENRESQTVYYEDIVKNTIDIPALNLYNTKIELNEFTKKFPDYKRAVYVNYNEVNKWIDELYK